MPVRGSALKRAVDYFKVADLEEAQYVLGRALTIVRQRAEATGEAKPTQDKPKRGRKPREQKPTPVDQTPLGQHLGTTEV